VAITDGQHDVMLFSDVARRCVLEESDVRTTGRASRGVIGMRLKKDQKVISSLVAESESQSVLTATENGSASVRRFPNTPAMHAAPRHDCDPDQRAQRQGGGSYAVEEKDEIMLITTGGVLIRTRVREIREMGRATQGVTLINLDKGEKLSGMSGAGDGIGRRRRRRRMI